MYIIYISCCQTCKCWCLRAAGTRESTATGVAEILPFLCNLKKRISQLGCCYFPRISVHLGRLILAVGHPVHNGSMPLLGVIGGGEGYMGHQGTGWVLEETTLESGLLCDLFDLCWYLYSIWIEYSAWCAENYCGIVKHICVKIKEIFIFMK